MADFTETLTPRQILTTPLILVIVIIASYSLGFHTAREERAVNADGRNN